MTGIDTTPRATVTTAALIIVGFLLGSALVAAGLAFVFGDEPEVAIPTTLCTEGTFPCLIANNTITVTESDGQVRTECLLVAYSAERLTITCGRQP